MGGSQAPRGPAGFGELVETHHPALYAFARRRLADQAAIEDVLADTFLVAWRRRAEIPDPALPWLYGVCLRTISTHRRAARRRTRLWSRLASEPPTTARDPADEHAERSEINRAFAQLSDEHGNVFDILLGDPARPRRYPGNHLALRREAFAAYPEARWVFYVGRRPEKGEAAQVVGFDGPTNAARALADRCKETGGRGTEVDGDRRCPSVRPVQIPRPD